MSDGEDDRRRQRREETCEAHLDTLSGTMSEGQLALEAVVLYRATGLPPPEWALAEISARYQLFTDGAPPSGWTRQQQKMVAPKTLGDAFEVPDIKDGKNAHAKRLRRVLLPQVWAAFNGPNALPKSDASYEEVAARLGITVNQVRRLALTKP
jgi:hypothetical protein